MSTPYLGEIRLVGFNFAPVGWEFCQGQLLPIAGYEALFNLLGTTYGGDGQTTFGLPDLRGRGALHTGVQSGLSYAVGQNGGTETVTLTLAQIPSHTHSLQASNQGGNNDSPTANYFGGLVNHYTSTGNSTSPTLLSSVGGGQAHNNLMPFVTMNYIIAVEGDYPSQN